MNRSQHALLFEDEVMTEDEYFHIGEDFEGEDSISTHPDSVETEAESISPRSLDSLAAAIGHDKVDTFLKAGGLDKEAEDGKGQDFQHSIRTAYSTLQAIEALSADFGRPDDDTPKNDSIIKKETWIRSLERRIQKSNQRPKKFASPGHRRVAQRDQEEEDTQSEEHLRTPKIINVPSTLPKEGNVQAQREFFEEDDFDPNLTSKYELEAFLELEEELHDAMRRKNKQSRLAFSSQVPCHNARIPQPRRPRYSIAADFEASVIERE